MDRPKWVAILTGAIALVLSIGYLLLVQLLDFRGEFAPAQMDISLIPMAVQSDISGDSIRLG